MFLDTIPLSDALRRLSSQCMFVVSPTEQGFSMLVDVSLPVLSFTDLLVVVFPFFFFYFYAWVCVGVL